MDTTNTRIVKIKSAGLPSVLRLSGLPNPSSLGGLLFWVTVDASGNLYISDWSNNRIVFVNVSGAPLTFVSTRQGFTSTDSPKAAALMAAGAPTGSVVTIAPSTLAAGDGDTNVAVAITVPATGAVTHWRAAMRGGLAPIMAGMFLLPWGGRLRRRLGSRGLTTCCVFPVLAVAVTLVGCGGRTPAPPPQPRSYTVTLTATSGGVTNSTTLHLTVQ